MNQYLHLFLDICFLRRGPQDLPVSSALLGITLALYSTAGLLVFTVHGTFAMAVTQSVADLVLLSGFAWLALRFRGLIARFPQTLTALTGTGAVLGFIAWPVILSLGQDAETEGVGIANLVFLGLFGWSLVVMTHILREAMEVGRGLATLVVVTYLAVSVVMTNFLLASLG